MATLDGALASLFDSLRGLSGRMSFTDRRQLRVTGLQLAVGEARKRLALRGSGASDPASALAALLELSADVSEAMPGEFDVADGVDGVLDQAENAVVALLEALPGG